MLAFIRWLAAVVVALLLPGTVSAAAEPIRIGSFLSLTGPYAVMGDPEKKTLDLYIERLNAAGGVLGRPIELVAFDDASDPARAASLMKRLIESERVDFVIGGSGTPTSLAAIPLAEKAGLPYLSLGGGVQIIDPVKPWVFKMPHTDRMVAEKVLGEMKARGLTRIGLLSENVGFGKSGREQTVQVAARLGIDIAADESYAPKDADVTAQLTRIKATPDVQALFIFGTGAGPAVAIRNVRQIGLSLPVYLTHGVASKDFLRLVGTAADGMRLPAAGLAVAEQLADGDSQKAMVLDYKTIYEAAFKEDVSQFGGHALDALNIAVAALKHVGSTDKAAFRDAVERTTGYMGTGGSVTFSPSDHLGLKLDSLHMVEVRDGAFVLSD